MAVFHPRIPKIIPDGKGGFREETLAEEKERLKKGHELEVEKQIKRIMDKGFDRTQAKYLYDLELSIKGAYNRFDSNTLIG